MTFRRRLPRSRPPRLTPGRPATTENQGEVVNHLHRCCLYKPGRHRLTSVEQRLLNKADYICHSQGGEYHSRSCDPSCAWLSGSRSH